MMLAWLVTHFMQIVVFSAWKEMIDKSNIYLFLPFEIVCVFFFFLLTSLH